jgi:Single-strand binding protein family
MSIFRLILTILLSLIITQHTGVQSFAVHESCRRISNIDRSSCVLHSFSSDENGIDSDDTDELSDEELEASVGTWDEKIARFNTIQLTGRVGNTPEARYFDDGKVVVNLSLASRRKYHGMERKLNNIKMGEEETDWYGLEIWVRLK